MTAEQEAQLERLFHAALELEPAARDAFLRQACGKDRELRQALGRLLRNHRQAGRFLSAPVWQAAPTLVAPKVGYSPGQCLSHYRIESLIGRGGMGEVYLAEDVRLGRKVALKFLPADMPQDAERLRRFEREAKATSALNHPNILTIYEIGESGRSHFIAAEFIEGQTLRRLISAGPLSLPDALDIALQIAGALKAAHAASIVHRDLKPENVMVREDGLVKVLDFGLAKLTEARPEEVAGDSRPGLSPEDTSPDPSGSFLTEAGRVLGTASYMSPEQASGASVDARSDLFSFGVVLYEMLAGQQPFSGGTANDLLDDILRLAPPQLAQLAPEAPREAERIVSRALRKDRAERYQSSAELLGDLKTLKQWLDGGAALASGEPWLRAFKRSWPLLALPLLAFVLIGVASFLRPARKDGTGAKAIAVLPFTNEGRATDTEYLSDGIAESLINSLSQLPGLKVIARSSSFRYKGKEADLRQVGQALGVTALVTGSVRQSADQVIISVELVDARNLTRLWGARYEQNKDHLPRLQSEIVSEIAATLRLSLTEGDQQQLTRIGASHPRAYELVLKGRFFRGKGTPEGRIKALDYFQQALAVEPNYALAWAELGNLYSSLMNVGEMTTPEAMSKARAAAERALALDRNLLEAHYTLANCKMDQWDWPGAADEFRRIIELNPNSARTLSGYAFVLAYTGQFEPAVEAARRARDLDPVSIGMNTRLGQVLYYARRYEEALAALRKTLEMDQRFSSAHLYLGLTSAAMGRYAEAIDAYREVGTLLKEPPYQQIYLGAAYAKAGARPQAAAIRNRLRTTKAYVSPCEMAILHAALGDREAALQALEEGYAAHDSQMQFLKVEPGYDPLRSDPRFQKLLRQMGLD